FDQTFLQRSLIKHVAGDELDPVLDMSDACKIDGAGASNQPINFVAVIQQQFGQVRAVLPGYTRDQGTFGHVSRSFIEPGRNQGALAAWALTCCRQSSRASRRD